MMKKAIGFLSILLGFALAGSAQRIVYSEPNRDDSKRMDFEIIGKIKDHFLIYKNIRNHSIISVYDEDMNEVDRVEQDYVQGDRLINADFYPYAEHFFMIYQYQRRNVIYCMAARIGGDGKKIGDEITIDTTHVGFTANDRIYSVRGSEDKNRIMVFKVNSRNKERYIMTTLLLNRDLVLQKRTELGLNMERNNEYLDEFQIDNDGDFVFTKFKRDRNDNISAAAFLVKPAFADSLYVQPFNLDKTYLDEIHVKVDNYNKRYFFTSFYYNERRGNVDGLYFNVWDKSTHGELLEKKLEFSENLKQEARTNAGIRTAFNDFFIRDIIIKRDGGFIVSTESFYTTSRYSSWNRWNYLYGGSPFYSPMNYYYSPYYSNWYWYGDRYNNNNGNTRYHADNIVVLSFDKDGGLQWNNVIKKEQFDDESGALVSFQMMNTGNKLHFLFNYPERRILLLTDFSIAPGGDMNRNPTLKNLDKGYEFLAKYGKQVSYNQCIIPCFYRNFICFAKLEYN